MIGAPTFIARSITLQIFAAYASDSEPPKTVKSWLKTKTGPAVDRAVAGDDAVAEDRVRRRRRSPRAVTNASSSTNEPGSSSRSSRSRAVSLPRACCWSIRAWPPPSRDRARIVRSRSIRSSLVGTVASTCRLSLRKDSGRAQLRSIIRAFRRRVTVTRLRECAANLVRSTYPQKR